MNAPTIEVYESTMRHHLKMARIFRENNRTANANAALDAAELCRKKAEELREKEATR